MPAGAKGRKGKIGKNKARISVYYSSGRNLFNKARRLQRHLRAAKHTNDGCAQEVFKLLKAAMPRNFSKLLDA